MNFSFIKILKLFFSSIFLIFTLTSCSNITKKLNFAVDELRNTSHKRIAGSNNFYSLVNELVQKQQKKLKKYINIDDIVLVSDFVNLDKLKNRSKLGFLLADHLKNALTNREIVVREVELGKEFQYGKQGFNLLTRSYQDINKKYVDSKFAFVGTYTITTHSLIVFVKLIDITNGNILSSASDRTAIDEEILELERVPKRPLIKTPLIL